jgi:hypothetical protein
MLDNTESNEVSEVDESAEKPAKKPKKVQYRALVGLNYGDVRVEVGEVAHDLPEDSIEWLLESNSIEKVS